MMLQKAQKRVVKQSGAVIGRFRFQLAERLIIPVTVAKSGFNISGKVPMLSNGLSFST